jgi:hypothetical protein
MVTLGAFIMLCVMTFNIGIFVAVVTGQTVGFALMPNAVEINQGLLHDLVQTSHTYQPEYEKCCTSTYE